jgi:hypothetical protein
MKRHLLAAVAAMALGSAVAGTPPPPPPRIEDCHLNPAFEDGWQAESPACVDWFRVKMTEWRAQMEYWRATSRAH